MIVKESDFMIEYDGWTTKQVVALSPGWRARYEMPDGSAEVLPCPALLRQRRVRPTDKVTIVRVERRTVFAVVDSDGSLLPVDLRAGFQGVDASGLDR